MIDLQDTELTEWTSRGKSGGCTHLLIVLDLEDKSYFPVFFFDEGDVQRYKENIISESKIEVVKDIPLT
jgi:hypothetical protein